MKQIDTTPTRETTTSTEPIAWETLEEFIRLQVEAQVQCLLEAEATEHLGRARYRRRTGASKRGYRNGLGKPRRLSLSCGTIVVRRPRLRDLEERFESRLLPRFARQSKQLKATLPVLYLEGLALRDFDRALRGLLGDGAPLSASTIERLKEHWTRQFAAWREEQIEEEIVYVWADGIYVKAGLEKDKAAVLVVIGVSVDGVKRVLAVEPGYRESTDSWKEVFQSLVRRGMNVPKAVIADGGLGLWAAIRDLGWPSKEQRCWNHKICNVQDALPKREQKRALTLLRAIPQSETLEEAVRSRDVFLEEFAAYSKACERLLNDWERLVSYYELPKEHWRGLRTSNVVESPFQVVRLRTGAARRYKKVENATAVIWKLLLIAESNFKPFDAAQLLRDVANGHQFANGQPKSDSRSLVA
jgi:transposase-like protein